MTPAQLWERRLAGWHRAYSLSRRAHIIQTSAPIKVLGQVTGGRFMACWAGSGPVDFMGVVEGRAIAFDAKSSEASRWPLKGLHEHQAQCLDSMALAGAVCGVALSCPSGEYWVPWDALGPLWWSWARSRATGAVSRGAASLSAADLERVGVKMRRNGWIDVVEVET